MPTDVDDVTLDIDTSSFNRASHVNTLSILSGNVSLSPGSGGSMLVNLWTTIDNQGDVAWLDVFETGVAVDFDTRYMDVLHGGRLRERGGLCQVDRVLHVGFNSYIIGYGWVELNGSFLGDRLNNDGVIYAEDFGAGLRTLTLQRAGVATFDLDGDSENGSVNATQRRRRHRG